jgi:nanoRNase/pAp phosphatase (c-di-AMP/oligoRNAs hydrolase)
MLEEEKKKKFEELVRSVDVVEIILHDHPAPDPDAVGAAMGLEKLIRDKFDNKIVLIYGIPPTRTANKMMVSELEVTLNDPRENYDGPVRRSLWVMLDCNAKSKSLNFWDMDSVPSHCETWTIDHHCDKDCPVGDNIDMHAVGSCCTLVVDYLKAFGVTFSPESKRDLAVATGMMLGLMTDTDSLLSERVDQSRDVEAFLYLRERYDPKIYTKIMHHDFPAYFYDYVNMSYTGKIISEPFGIYNLGYLKEERSGVISQIADHWMRRERLNIVVVFAIVGKELRASIRTKNGGQKASEISRILFPDCGAGGDDHLAGATMQFKPFVDVDLLDEEGKQDLLRITTKTLVARAKKITDLDE